MLRKAIAIAFVLAVASVASAWTPPAAPSGLTGTAGPLGSGYVNLSWTDNSTDEANFQVERALSASGPFGLIGSPVPASFTDNGSGLGFRARTVYYRVRAVNGDGASAYSSTFSVLWPGKVSFP